MYEEEIQEIEDEEFLFKEYSMDDTLDALTRLERYYNSDFSLQRLVLIRDLPDNLNSASFDYFQLSSRVMPILGNFVSDSEPAVRQVFAEVVPVIAETFLHAGEEHGYNDLLASFIPFTFELIIDKNVDVGRAATTSLSRLASALKRKDLDSQVLMVILTLARDPRVEEYRIVAAQLLNELSPILGKDVTLETVVKEVASLAEDVSFSVRKTVAQNLAKICETIGPEATIDHILPIYSTLSLDEIWGVRKSCAESLVSISKAIRGHDQVRADQLSALFEQFAEDISRWVRIAAFQHIGPFIATFESPTQISNTLLQLFIDSASLHGTQYPTPNSNLDGNAINEIVECAAFNFPAVLLTFGGGESGWQRLRESYAILVRDMQWKVRRSLACSLHEIAKLIGVQLTESDLVEPFTMFLRDLDEVKIGVLEHLGEFLSFIRTPTLLKDLLPICFDLAKETDHWRIRDQLANQLGAIALLLPSPGQSGDNPLSDAMPNLCNIVMRLLTDSVAHVRLTTIESVGIVVLKKIADFGPDRDAVRNDEFICGLVSLASEKTYSKRQLFINICKSIVRCRAPPSWVEAGGIASVPEWVMEQIFFPHLEPLKTDPVPNIRITLAKFLSEILLHNEPFCANPSFVSLRNSLIADPDRDTAHFASSDACVGRSTNSPHQNGTNPDSSASPPLSSNAVDGNHIDSFAAPTDATSPSEPNANGH